jgi:hypothetical protein
MVRPDRDAFASLPYLGQPDLATTSSGLSDSKIYLLSYATLDKGGRLWASDRINNTVVRVSPPSAYVEVQPDLSIGLKPDQLRARNRFNTTGRKRETFSIRLLNDGYTTNSNILRATRKNKSYKLRYRGTAGNLTGAITQGQLQTDTLSKNGDAKIEVDLKTIRRGVEKRKTFKGKNAANDPNRFARNVVRLQLKAKGWGARSSGRPNQNEFPTAFALRWHSRVKEKQSFSCQQR